MGFVGEFVGVADPFDVRLGQVVEPMDQSVERCRLGRCRIGRPAQARQSRQGRRQMCDSEISKAHGPNLTDRTGRGLVGSIPGR